MSFLNQRILQIKPSPTLMMTQKAKELKNAGQDIVNLAGGEPNFLTPSWICEASYKATEQGKTLYTAVDGTKSLKNAIIEKFKRENHLTYHLEEVIVGTGSKQVLYNAFMATLNPEDEVIIFAPYWPSYPDIIHLAGGKPVIVTCSASQDFKPTIDQLEKAITPKTKWILLNSPSNPTGSILSKKELISLGETIEKYPNIHIMTDDIYEHLRYCEDPFYTIAQVCPDLISRTLTVNGVSKAFAMTGWRIGYGAGPAPLIKAMKTIQSQSTSNPCSIAQEAAVAALTGPQHFLQDWRDDYLERCQFFMQDLKEKTKLRFRVPEGAFYLYVDCSAWIGAQTPKGNILSGDMDVADFLLESYKLAVTPGKVFGLSPYLRVTFSVEKKDLEKAVNRLQEAEKVLQ